MKKIISILLLLCLVVGVLPVTALADAPAKIMLMGSVELSVTEGGAPAYTKNKSFEAANSPDGGSTFTAWTQEICDGTGTWNVKFEWPEGGTPTITLKNAKFDYFDNDTDSYAYIDRGGDYVSTANRTTADLENDGSTAFNLLVAAIMPAPGHNYDLNIILQGNNLVETGSGFVLGAPDTKANGNEQAANTYANTYFKELTFVGEGENSTVASCDGIGIFNRSGYDVSFLDVNLTISTTATGTNAIPIHITKGNLTIDGGNINVTKSDRFGIWTTGNGDITINSGMVSATGSQGAGATNGVINSAGMLIINGGTVKATPQKAVGLYGAEGIEVNGGTVEIISPYYGINAGGDIVFNGGTTTIKAQYAFYNAANLQISSDMYAFAGASAKKCEVYDGTDTKLAKKPWMLITDDESQCPEMEEDDDIGPSSSTSPSWPNQNTGGTNATGSSSTKATRPSTTPTNAVEGDPVASQPVATEEATPSETQDTIGTSAPVATKPAETSKSTKATEESKATEETTVGKDADKDKENGKDTNKDKDKDDDTDEKKSGPNVVLIIVLVVVVLAGAGVAAWFALKPKAATPEEKTEE